MARLSSYAPGTPSYVDLMTTDMDAAKAFYGALFGWTGEPSPYPEAMGYTPMMLGDAHAAGIGPTFTDAPPCWNTYVTTADVEATLASATAAGGKVIVEPMDVFDDGRMGGIMDPGGAALMLWQPLNHIGSQVRAEPGALSWVELNTRNAARSKEFYGTLFGWTFNDEQIPASESSPGYVYTQILLGAADVGGMLQMDQSWPAELPEHWMVYFSVADCGAAAAQVTELGGDVCVPPTDIPPGRFAVVNDGQGATFTIIALSPEVLAHMAGQAD